MIEVKISVSSPTWKSFRQTPGRKGIWENCRFHYDDTLDQYDFWVCNDWLTGVEHANCDSTGTILMTGEPPSMKSYERRYTAQFSTVVTFRQDIDHPHIVRSQPALGWWVGKRLVPNPNGRHEFVEDSLIDYDSLKSFDGSGKDQLISVVTSGKRIREGHKRRLAFVNELKNIFGGDISIFAPGEMELVDKWDAIARYKYHIAIENSQYPDYWTEKLADSFLGLAYPFYYGCPNINEFFPSDSMTRIDIAKPRESAISIQDAIDNDVSNKARGALIESKRLIMDEYNYFATLSHICQGLKRSGRFRRTTIYPEGHHPLDWPINRAHDIGHLVKTPRKSFASAQREIRKFRI